MPGISGGAALGARSLCDHLIPTRGKCGSFKLWALGEEEEEGGWLQSWPWGGGSLREEGTEWELHSGFDCQEGTEGRGKLQLIQCLVLSS